MQENAPQAGVNDIVGIKNLEAEFDVELAKELAQAYLDDTDSIMEFARNNFPDVVEAFTQTKAILQQYLLS